VARPPACARLWLPSASARRHPSARYRPARQSVDVSIRDAFRKAFRLDMLCAAALAGLSAGGAVVIAKRRKL